MNQQVCSAFGLRLQVSVRRLSITINAVVNIKWNHVVRLSVRKCKERWGWYAVVNIIAIDKLRLLWWIHWYKSRRGGVVVKMDPPCHALEYKFGCGCGGSGDAFLIQMRREVLRW